MPEDLGPPAGTAIVARLNAAAAVTVARKHTEVLAAARINGLDLLALHQAVLRGRPPDVCPRLGAKLQQPSNCARIASCWITECRAVLTLASHERRTEYTCCRREGGLRDVLARSA